MDAINNLRKSISGDTPNMSSAKHDVFSFRSYVELGGGGEGFRGRECVKFKYVTNLI
jgi:hypothetical protein